MRGVGYKINNLLFRYIDSKRLKEPTQVERTNPSIERRKPKSGKSNIPWGIPGQLGDMRGCWPTMQPLVVN